MVEPRQELSRREKGNIKIKKKITKKKKRREKGENLFFLEWEWVII